MSQLTSKNNCNHCGYEWLGRVDNPKACPRCKARLDYWTYNGRNQNE